MLNFKKNRMKKHTFCRFSILLSIILVFLLYPMSSMGAQKYISVKGEDMTIKQAIQLIEKNVSIRPRACFSPSYNKVKSQTKHVWLLTLL